MKIAVTGANGFLGRYVIENLASQPENQIYIYGRYRDTVDLPFKNIHRRDLDLFDATTVEAINDEVDVLIHLAWAGIPEYDNQIHLAQVPSHVNLIRKFGDLGVRKVFIAGTCFEYGNVAGEISESHAVNPKNVYASAKNQLRELTEDLSATAGFDLAWGRLFYLYGKNQPSHTLCGALLRAASTGKSSFRIVYPDLRLDYSPASMIADYVTCLILREDPVGVVNLGSGIPKALGLLAQSWIEEFGLTIKLEFGSDLCLSPSFWADVTKLRSLIN